MSDDQKQPVIPTDSDLVGTRQSPGDAEQKPRVTVGVFIFNRQGEFFLARSPKWGDRLVVPSGHVEYGESLEDAAKREIKEETGLDIKDLEIVSVDGLVDSAEFAPGKRHFVCVDYRARLSDESQKVILDNRETSEYLWIKPKDAAARDDVEFLTKKVIKDYLLKEKKGLFGRACKDCEKRKKESEEYKAGWQRALADYKNLQRETAERRGEWALMSEQQILEDFIPVYDNFKKAFAVALPLPEGENQRGWEQWRQGIEFIKKQFGEVLKSHGVEEIKTVGERFDPKWHEAAGEAPAPAPAALPPLSKGRQEGLPPAAPGTILKEVDGGYKMGDRVIKPAKVIVVK